MRVLLPMIALALGCGAPPTPPPFAPAGRCRVAGLGTLHTQDSRPCNCVALVAEHALTTLRSAGLVLPGDDFTPLEVYIRASDDLWMDDGDELGGKFVPEGPYAEVTRSGGELVHEMLHFLQIDLRGVEPGISGRHEGWASNGYFSTVDAFVEETDPLSVPYTGTPCVDAGASN